ncbi:hypothetical protein, partial [Listeria booriae]|uniref:hypothetical protein n=1 Tax=Listeria booriae TaxID=1552123 RepID=UPI001C89961B
CLELPSDSTSPWTPLLLARCLPLLGRTRDFHPLEFAHAGQTKQKTIIMTVLEITIQFVMTNVKNLAIMNLVEK